MSLKFLHSMKELEYLESAFENGLLFTPHTVNYKLSENKEILINDFNSKKKLTLIKHGKIFENLTSKEQTIISYMLAPIQSNVKMLCFTELENRDNMSHHTSMYGNYGFIFTQDFIEKNDGDRVMYFGNNSPASRQLKNIIDLLMINSLHYSEDRSLIGDTEAFKIVTNNMCFIENRKHIKEFEWRIPENLDLFKQFENDNMNKKTYLSFKLSDITHIIINDKSEAERINKLIQNKSKNDNYKGDFPIIITSENITH